MVLHFLALHQGQAAGLCSLLHMFQLCAKIAFAKILSIYSKLLGGTKPSYPHRTMQGAPGCSTEKEIPDYNNLGFNFETFVMGIKHRTMHSQPSSEGAGAG